MLERLDFVRLAPRRILDMGSGPPSEALARRYPKAEVVAVDFALQMLRQNRRRFSFFNRKNTLRICGDFTRLPLEAGCCELVWSGMSLHWAADPLAALQEFQRVLAPEGLLMLSSLGPDSLKELRVAAGGAHVHAFTDMHDIGDMLVAAGFAAPVMDMEVLTLMYENAGVLLADLRASGQTSARADRPRGLAGKEFGARLRAALPRHATFEVVYGHAWKPAPVKETAKTVRVFKRIP